jgi:hypothetical protein
MPDALSHTAKSIYVGIDNKLNNIQKDIELLKENHTIRCGKFEMQMKLISVILGISIFVTALHLVEII